MKCKCGNEFKTQPQHFLSERTVSCGCIRAAQNLDIAGKIFNDLLVLEMLPPVPSDKRRKQRALVKCFCGNEFITTASEIKRNRIKSCGCLRNSSMSIRRSVKNGKSLKEKAWNWYFGSYKNSATKRGLDFELDLKIFKDICGKECHYCGLSPSPKNRYRNDISAHQDTIDASTIYVNGIDRLNPDIGYITENCVPCCTECNYHKRTYTYEQFISWIRRLSEHYGKAD